MAKFNEAFEESLRAGGASRQKSINSSTLRDVITNRSLDDYKEGAGQGKINNALRFFDKAGILDMTVEQLASDEGKVIFVNAMTGDAYAELGKNQANEASKFISGIFEDAGHGKAWGSNTLKRELSPERAKELFPIEATQQKVKGYPDDFFTRTKRVVMELQAAGQKEAAAQFLLSITGGYRAADLKDVRVEDIDFRTGVLFDVEIKGAGETVDKTGIFSSPQLDVIKDYLGGRTEGLLFADPEANAKIINAQLKKSFPSDYLTKKSKAKGTHTTGVTLYDYRHFNETYLSSLDVSTELRKVATLRAPKSVSEKYAASGARRKDVNRLHGGLLSLYAAGSNTSSPAQFLNDALAVRIGVDDADQPVYSQPIISDKTKKLTATKELIEQVGYEDAISPSLYAALPEEGDVMGTRLAGVDPETTAAINQQVQSEAVKASLQADIDAGEMAEAAAEGRAKAQQTRKDLEKQNKEQKLSGNMDFLMRNIDKYKGVIVGGLATAAGVIGNLPGVAKAGKLIEAGLETAGAVGSVQEGASTREQMMQMGMPPTAATAIGAAKTTADFLSPASILPPQPAVADPFSPRPVDRAAAEIPEVTANVQRSEQTEPLPAPVKIPDPVPSAPPMAAQGFAQRRNEARTAAMRGEETPLAQSFLYGGIVR